MKGLIHMGKMTTLLALRKTLSGAMVALTLGAGAIGYSLRDVPRQLGSVASVADAEAAAPQPTSPASLPDFSTLVSKFGAAVVNITVESDARRVAMPNADNPFEGTPFGEFFRFVPPAPPTHSMGSGFLISDDGYLLTNAHVVGEAKTVTVKLTDKREMEGKVVGRDPATDVALVKIEAANLPHVTLADPKDLKVGEWVVAIGSPYGFENSVTAGIVSATGRSLPGDAYVPFIQTDVAVNPGNSGGPLFNLKGEVVGINSQIFSRSGGYQGLSFAIPIDIAQQVATQLKTTGSVTRGWLGVTIQDVNQDLAKAFNLDKPRGALVSALAENGPAKSAGIKEGDVIIAVDGQTIESSGDLARLIGAGAPGRTASLDLIHNGKRTTRTVKLGTVPGSKDVESASNDEQGGAKLNVTVAELGPEQKTELGVDHGVVVQDVKPGAAARAGVQPGDVILQVNGKRVESVSTLRKGLDALAKGQPAALLIKRGDSTLFVPVEPNAEGVG